jgi:hypothetical protein
MSLEEAIAAIEQSPPIAGTWWGDAILVLLAAAKEAARQSPAPEGFAEKLALASSSQHIQPPAPEGGDGLPDVHSEGGANTLDEIMGFIESARTAKSGLSLDWVEVGILQRALLARAPRAEGGSMLIDRKDGTYIRLFGTKVDVHDAVDYINKIESRAPLAEGEG